jgi:hypothetical protein
MAKKQGSDGRIDKCKISILNIDSTLIWIILGLRNMEVLNFASPKWVYILKSVEKWLCKTWKYKTVVGGAILNNSSILQFRKKVTSTIFFLWNNVCKSKISNDLWNIRVFSRISSWIYPPYWNAISQNSYFFLHDLDYQNKSLDQL